MSTSKLALLILGLGFVGVGPVAGSETAVPDGLFTPAPRPVSTFCSQFDKPGCYYSWNFNLECCVASGSFCAGFCPEPIPDCSQFNRGSCTYAYDPDSGCCVKRSGFACPSYCFE